MSQNKSTKMTGILSEDIHGLIVKDVVTSVIIHNGKILILHRSDKVGTYKGLWAGVSGHIEPGDKSEDRALTEIFEETNIDKTKVKILKKGELIFTRGDGNIVWRVQSFLVESQTNIIRLDWEHTEYKWILLSEIDSFDTVPNYKQVVKSLLNLL